MNKVKMTYLIGAGIVSGISGIIIRSAKKERDEQILDQIKMETKFHYTKEYYHELLHEYKERKLEQIIRDLKI